jgi:hypothetical protein
MIHINEWDKVRWDDASSSDGKPSKAPVGSSAAAPRLVDLISSKLSSLKPEPPCAVHFYLGEGLRWIRVGFDEEVRLKPSAVAAIGKVIAGCMAPAQSLYFHALRTHDLLFFLEGGNTDSVGMPPRCFGLPLPEVLQAWASKT